MSDPVPVWFFSKDIFIKFPSWVWPLTAKLSGPADFLSAVYCLGIVQKPGGKSLHSVAFLDVLLLHFELRLCIQSMSLLFCSWP